MEPGFNIMVLAITLTVAAMKTATAGAGAGACAGAHEFMMHSLPFHMRPVTRTGNPQPQFLGLWSINI